MGIKRLKNRKLAQDGRRSTFGDGENSERVEGRGARKRMLQRFGTVPADPATAAFAIYSILSFPSRGEQKREKEKERYGQPWR